MPGWSLSLPRGDHSDPSGALSCLLHHGAPVRTSFTPNLVPPREQCLWPRSVGTGWAQPWELQSGVGRWCHDRCRGDGGESPRVVGEQCRCHWARSKPQQARRGGHPSWQQGTHEHPALYKPLLPQGGWKQPQQHPHSASPPAEMPAVPHGVSWGLSPAWAHHGVLVGGGEATLAPRAPGLGGSRCTPPAP